MPTSKGRQALASRRVYFDVELDEIASFPLKPVPHVSREGASRRSIEIKHRRGPNDREFRK
jgi:hypothetical protein